MWKGALRCALPLIVSCMETPEKKPIQPKDEHVLVVDDDEIIRNLLREQLSMHDFNVRCVASAEDAWGALSRDDFSLVLADINLPQMDGLAMIQKIKSRHEDLRIIVISGQADIDYPIKALRAGADDYFMKPFDAKALIESVFRSLEERHVHLRAKYFEEFLRQRVLEATQGLEKANRELQKTKDFLENILENSPDSIMIMTNRGEITYISNSAESMLGYSREDLTGQSAATLFVGGLLEVRRLMRSLRQDKRVQNYETEFVRSSGEDFSVSLSASLLEDLSGSSLGVVCICKDVTEQKRLEENLRELSIRDNLTNLYNQRHFYERLTKEMERARRQNHPLSLLLFDIDNFKYYNDTRGHLEGDVVLQELGAIVNEGIRQGVDSGHRYGGDEFTVIVAEAAKDPAQQIGERICRAFADAGFERLTLSMGLVEHQPEMDIKEFISRADQAMYTAKRTGGNQVHIGGSEEPVNGDA